MSLLPFQVEFFREVTYQCATLVFAETKEKAEEAIKDDPPSAYEPSYEDELVTASPLTLDQLRELAEGGVPHDWSPDILYGDDCRPWSQLSKLIDPEEVRRWETAKKERNNGQLDLGVGGVGA